MSLGKSKRVKKRRDALAASLEKTFSERSMLAARTTKIKKLAKSGRERDAQEIKKNRIYGEPSTGTLA